MSEANQDSSSKAQNMQIQTLMPAPLPKAREARKIRWHRIQEVATEDALLLDHSVFDQIPSRESTSVRN